jgi:EAL domain-containing protein (putative c-di-GMP-specific phosphodiesterase class I)/GGDEF domain-containing protein
VPIAGSDSPFVEAPTLGVVDASVRVEPDVSALAFAVALLILYVGHRLVLRRPPGAGVSGCLTWYAAGLGFAGLALVTVAVGGWLGAPAFVLAIVVNLAAVVSGALYLPALLTMPGPATTLQVRLRRALDGAIVGLCLAFCGRIVAQNPNPHHDSPAFWLIMFHCCVLATAVLAGVRPRAGRRGPVLCAAGVGAATVGLSHLAFTLPNGAPTALSFAFMALLLAAPVLIWRGAGALAASSAAMVPRAPLIAVPAALALCVALFQLFTGGELDRGAMMLGTFAGLAAGARRVLAARAAPAGESGARDDADRPCDPRGAEPAGLPTTALASEAEISVAIDAMRAAPGRSGALLVIGIDVGDAVDAPRDEVLCEVARRLREVASPVIGADLTARLTTTEFALLTSADLTRAYALAERLVTRLAEPMPGQARRISACVGLTDLAGAAGAADAIQRAQLALRRARHLGRWRVEWYDSAVAVAVARRERLERELPDAAPRGELDLIYQPIMDLERGRPLAVEALLRWRHPELGTLLPADVIPVAEATGAIADVGHWVLRRATAQLAAWRAEGRDLSMAINISPCQLGTADLRADVAAVLAAHDLPPDRLVLELAESGIEDGAGLDECVGALRSMGVRTALDEFGTGVASLVHLRTLPIDMVKIGQPLVSAGASLPLINVMVGVGRRLGIEVVAQGVEVPDQLAAVRDAGCRLGQGHLFARPQPAERTEAYLDGFAAR